MARKALLVALAAGFFLLAVPGALVWAAGHVDAWLDLPRGRFGAANFLVALLLGATGLTLLGWSVATQLRLGAGTPVPISPTTKLVVTGPYALCRNPINLGLVACYVAVGLCLGSISALLLVLVFWVGLALYLKLIEEKRLEAQFGGAYREYRRLTPTWLPRIKRESREPERSGAPVMPDLTIRPMRSGEEAAVIALVARVFDETVAPHYSEAGVQEFYGYAAPEPLAARLQSDHFILVAEQGDALVGMIEMRHAEHVAMLFVEPRGRGTGRRLLQAALAVCMSQHSGLSHVTVHSSPNAVPAYECLGFRATDQERELNGIRFIPMVLEITP